MSIGTYGVIRPYDVWMRAQVSDFLASIGYAPAEALVVAPGTSDDRAAGWVDTVSLDLLLLPYNKHRSESGIFVDGIGVALLLSEHFVRRPVPILMQVTDFSRGASFSRRFGQLEQKRPEIASRIVVVSESETDWAGIAARIREIAVAPP